MTLFRVYFVFIVILLQSCNFQNKENSPISSEVIALNELGENKIYKVVDEMPRFSGCEDKGIISKNELKKCSDEEMLKFIFKNLKYPSIAKEQLIVGKIVVQFVVEKNGTLGNIKMIKDPGGVFENEVKRVLELMPNWIAGKQDGKLVSVLYTIPMHIKPE